MYLLCIWVLEIYYIILVLDVAGRCRFEASSLHSRIALKIHCMSLTIDRNTQNVTEVYDVVISVPFSLFARLSRYNTLSSPCQMLVECTNARIKTNENESNTNRVLMQERTQPNEDRIISRCRGWDVNANKRNT